MTALGNLVPMTLAQRLRQSLFVIPGVGLLVGGILGEVVVQLDREGVAGWLPDGYETSSDNARAVLGAIATGTITVVTLVLTLTLVAIQLAAGQLSPRTIVNFLGDRFQQATVAVVLATGSFSLVALRSIRTDAGDDIREPDLTVLVAVLATLVSLLMLVRSVDRTANRLAVGELVRDLADETCRLIADRYADAHTGVAVERPGRVVARSTEPGEGGIVVTAPRAGWIQHVDQHALLSALPDQAGVEILHQVGTFVFAEMPLLQVQVDHLDEDARSALANTIAIGDQRTMQQDVAFGLTRLTDIGLRALSPGVNDPNAAREVMTRLGQVVLTLQAHELEPEQTELDGHHVVRRGAPTHDAFTREAFEQLRLAAAEDRVTLRTLSRVLDVVRTETQRRDLPGSTDELERQRRLVAERLEALGEPIDGADPDRPPSMP